MFLCDVSTIVIIIHPWNDFWFFSSIGHTMPTYKVGDKVSVYYRLRPLFLARLASNTPAACSRYANQVLDFDASGSIHCEMDPRNLAHGVRR